MQDPYAGDIGDHGKFALLRAIALETGRSVGLNWWRTSAGARPNDGRHTGYLTTAHGERRYRPADPVLYDALRAVVTSGQRSVAALERAALIPGTARYFGEALDYDGVKVKDRIAHRAEWIQRGQVALRGSDVALLDADNGLEVASVPITRAAAPKYVFCHEARAFAEGRSLVVYQHLDHNLSAGDQIARRFAQLLPARAQFAVRHHRGTGRVYLFAPLDAHLDELLRAVRVLLAAWPRDFSLIA